MISNLVSLFVFFMLGPPLLGTEGPCGGGIGTWKAFLEGCGPGEPHPATGIWEGTAHGSGLFLPETGTPLKLWIRVGGAEPQVTFILEGFDRQDVPATYRADLGRLCFQGRAPNDTRLDYELSLEGDSATGHARGHGLEVELELKRSTLDVQSESPAPRLPADWKTLSSEDWATDLDFLREELPRVHRYAFHCIDEEDWRESISALQTRLDEYEPDQLGVATASIVARIGDAHTGVHWREAGAFKDLPLRLEYFDDGLFVVAVDERYAEALSARVMRIGKHSTEHVAASVSSVFAADNEHWRRAMIPTHLVVPELLYALGLIDHPDRLPLGLELHGEVFEVVVRRQSEGEWLQVPDPRFERAPRWRTRQDERYWMARLLDEKALYFAYNSCTNDPKRPLERFLDELLSAYDQMGAERLIVDLRCNSGGNSTVLGNQIQRLTKHEGLAGRIVCLIGPRTYSSGMLNAHQLREEAGAILVGEPTGGKPNSFGEVRSFRLPRSGLKVFYSTKLFRLYEHGDPIAVEPDLRVGLSAEEYFDGQDPALKAALLVDLPSPSR